MADRSPLVIDATTGDIRAAASTDNVRALGSLQTNGDCTFGGNTGHVGYAQVTGATYSDGRVNWRGDVTLPALTTAASPYNSYSGTGFSACSRLRQDVTSPATVTGMLNGEDGEVLVWVNIATALANTTTFTHEDVLSTATQRFTLPGGAPLVLGAGGTQVFQYDITTTRWRAWGPPNYYTPATPTRALDATFTPSATNYTLCSYTIEFATAAGNDGSVELRSDTASPPTTVRESARSALVGGTSITIRQTLRYLCPPAHTIKLVTAGTGTITIAHQTEVSFL